MDNEKSNAKLNVFIEKFGSAPTFFKDQIFRSGIMTFLLLTFSIVAAFLMPSQIRNISLVVTGISLFQLLRFSYIVLNNKWTYIQNACVTASGMTSKGNIFSFVQTADNRLHDQVEVLFEDLDTGIVYNALIPLKNKWYTDGTRFGALIPDKYIADKDGIRYIQNIYDINIHPDAGGDEAPEEEFTDDDYYDEVEEE